MPAEAVRWCGRKMAEMAEGHRLFTTALRAEQEVRSAGVFMSVNVCVETGTCWSTFLTGCVTAEKLRCWTSRTTF